MHSNDFEEKFGAFLENQKYDLAQEALFQVVRAAFIAGWEAADGPPSGQYKFSAAESASRSHIIRPKES